MTERWHIDDLVNEWWWIDGVIVDEHEEMVAYTSINAPDHAAALIAAAPALRDALEAMTSFAEEHINHDTTRQQCPCTFCKSRHEARAVLDMVKP